jgi:hypothetical protein
MFHFRHIWIGSAVVLFGLLAGCQVEGTLEPTQPQEGESPPSTSTQAEATPTEQAIPLPALAFPDPPLAGEANVYGRFVWNGQPIAGVHVILGGFSQEGEVIDEERISNDDGAFYFLNIPAGEQFNFTPFVPEDSIPEPLVDQEYSLDWVMLDLPAGESVILGNIHLLEVDLMLRSPERGASVSGETLTLAWDPYPGARSYRVEVIQNPGDYVEETYETSDTALEIQVPQLSCLFGWEVTALNEWGEPFARSDLYKDEEDHFQATYDGLFVVENPELPSCEITVLTPSDHRVYELGEDLGLAWEPNPWVMEYFVLINRTRDAHNYADSTYFRSNLVMVDENGQPLGLELPELTVGEYTFLVIGYAEDGSILAESDWLDFTIE